jgi:bifunctional UDP-N-acetylglucosamine pyrophosphorylase/glucosamine-1-phosphate N-acetyltransferase
MKRDLISISVVVLAAGKGTRMGSVRPKVLYQVCGKPLLYYTFKALNKLSEEIKGWGYLDKIGVVVGYGQDKVKETFKDEGLYWVEQKEPRGTADALASAQGLLQKTEGLILVLCGDAPLIRPRTLRELIQTHLVKPAAVATILTGQLDDPTGYGRILRDKRSKVKGIIEEKEARLYQKKINEINSGIYVFNCDVFKPLKKIKVRSENGEYYLTDLIDIFAEKKQNIKTYLADSSECLGVNTFRELNMVEEIMRERIIKEHQQKGVNIIAPELTYIEEGVIIGKGTIIYPFSVIRSGVRIGEGCEVGPFSHLRSGTVLEDGSEVGNFTETKKTRLGRHSKAKHLSYLGDAIIGNNVNIGAGTITANYDGVRKEQTIIEDGASTGSGTILIAPVRMGKSSVTGAGAVVAKGKNVPNGKTVVGIPAKELSHRPVCQSREAEGGLQRLKKG